LRSWRGASSESGGSIARIDLDASSMQSLRPAAGLSGRWDFESRGIAWRATLDASMGAEMLDTRYAVETTFLGQTLPMRSAASGRLNVGLSAGLEARLDERLSGRLELQHEGSQGHRATAARFNLLYRW
jgi:hypothetical protein